jgi:biofilm PGA synthesis lipoprotein PgaB
MKNRKQSNEGRLLLRIALIFLCLILSRSSYAVNDAVILMYHNIAADTPSSTSVTPTMFKKHMQYLAENNFTIWPLIKILSNLKAGKSIPEKTISITFDDASRSVYTEAFPLLKEKGWPFTLFVTTQYVTAGYRNYMTWDQLREVEQYGAEIGNHGHTHTHYKRKQIEETDNQWQQRIKAEIGQAQTLLEEQLDQPIRAVAYPYGEYSSEIKKILLDFEFYGLGQHSGAVSQTSDFQAIPRFPITTGFDSLEDFATKIRTKNLPVTVLSPTDGKLGKAIEIPELKLRLEEGDYQKHLFACYASGQGRIKVEWAQQAESLVTIKANQVIKPGRSKYNCTAPSKSKPGIYYWFSFLWMKPESNGRWYKE